MLSMRVGLCQMQIQWEDKEANQIKVAEFVREAAKQQVELLVFPEMCLTGFSMDVLKTQDQFEETIDFFRELARNFEIFLGFGWTKVSAHPGKGENHFTVVNSQGQVVSDYIKIHPFQFAGEDAHFVPGEQIVTFSIGSFTVSTFICYDLRFPEIFQAASQKADLIIIAANWPRERREHWRCLLQARAIENQVYILGVNGVGAIGQSIYTGDSTILGPTGNILKEISLEEGLLIEDLKNDIEEVRRKFPIKMDRRAELYKNYYV